MADNFARTRMVLLYGTLTLTLEGNARYFYQVIQLNDGRVCSGCGGPEANIKLWSLDSGQAEMTITGHTGLICCIGQLSDGRICSASLNG